VESRRVDHRGSLQHGTTNPASSRFG
jgi:hypothetical protein